MSVLLDNVAAVIVSMIVFVLLASIQHRSIQQQVAQQSRQTVVERAQELGRWLREDLERIGDNIEPGENAPYPVAFENPQESGGTPPLTTEFVFYRDSVQANGQKTQVATRYRVQSVGSREVGGETKTLYQLRRAQRVGGGTWTATGASMPSLLGFQVDLLNRNAVEVSNPETAAENDLDAVRMVRVRFFLAAPFQNELLSLQSAHVGTIVVRYPMAEIRS
jgi:hypothetical protein